MAWSPEQESALNTIRAEIEAEVNASFNTRMDKIILLIEGLQQKLSTPWHLRQALQTPLPAPPPAPKPCAQTTPPELPPQLIPTPVPTRSYPPSPSVETIEEVEQKQVYKPLRNVKQMRRKHGASRRRRMRRIRNTEFFENCIAWPPKCGGTYIRFSRDEEPDTWYTTMLNHRQKLIDALPNPA